MECELDAHTSVFSTGLGHVQQTAVHHIQYQHRKHGTCITNVDRRLTEHVTECGGEV